jgi:hypothetical protein
MDPCLLGKCLLRQPALDSMSPEHRCSWLSSRTAGLGDSQA